MVSLLHGHFIVQTFTSQWHVKGAIYLWEILFNTSKSVKDMKKLRFWQIRLYIVLQILCYCWSEDANQLAPSNFVPQEVIVQ